VKITRGETSHGDRLFRVEFLPPMYGLYSSYFPIVDGKQYELFQFSVADLATKARTFRAVYHEFYHADQFRRGFFPPIEDLKNPAKISKKQIAAIEIDAHEKTIEYMEKLQNDVFMYAWERDCLLRELTDLLHRYRFELNS
jgi:hypothetical protein